MGRAADLTGATFGRLVVTQRAPTLRGRGDKRRYRSNWNCVCECGNTLTVSGENLRSGHTRSCGCLCKDKTKEASITHGMTGTKLYGVWRAMLSRCKYGKKIYSRYSGRGIQVCREWQSFEGFLKDMGGSYSQGLTLDRVDNNGNYEKSNCRWATRAEQGRNKGNNIVVLGIEGAHTLSEACRKFGVPINTVRNRWLRGEDIDDVEIYRGPYEKRLDI